MTGKPKQAPAPKKPAAPKHHPVPDFRTFFQERNGTPWPAYSHESTQDVLNRLAETAADYFDELRRNRHHG